MRCLAMLCSETVAGFNMVRADPFLLQFLASSSVRMSLLAEMTGGFWCASISSDLKKRWESRSLLSGHLGHIHYGHDRILEPLDSIPSGLGLRAGSAAMMTTETVVVVVGGGGGVGDCHGSGGRGGVVVVVIVVVNIMSLLLLLLLLFASASASLWWSLPWLLVVGSSQLARGQCLIGSTCVALGVGWWCGHESMHHQAKR